MELQEQLKEEAIALGACEEGIASWGEPDVNALCEKYFKYQDFCIKHNWPSVEQIKSADREIVEANGIFVDGVGVCNNLPDMVVMGSALVEVYVLRPCNLTVRHKGEVNVHVNGGVLCYISMHDDCKVNIVSKHPKGRIAVSYWSGTIENKEMVDKIYKKEK